MFRLLVLLSSFSIVFCAIGGLIGRMQSTRASGTLICNGRPAAGVVIKLYDDDRGFDTDDFMGETKTDSRGNFEVSGHLREMSRIDPKINIYHDCNDEFKPCQRKVSIKIPDTYITAGKSPRKSYNAGTLELAGKFPGETRDCIH